MGECYYQLHQFKKAYESFKEAFNEAKQVHQEKPHRDISNLLENIGQTLQELGDLHKATEIHHQSLRMKMELFSEKKITASHMAGQLNNLGICQCRLGEHQKSIDIYTKGVNLIQSLDTKREKVKLTFLLNNKASCLFDLKKYDLALSTYNEALDLEYQIHGKEANNESIAVTLNNIAIVYSSQGDHQKSLELNMKNLKMRQAFYGPAKNAHIASSQHNIGEEYRYLGQNDRALDHLEEALVLRQEFLGKNHMETANTLLELSNTHLALNDIKSAKNTIAEAHAIASKAEGYPEVKQGIEKAFKALHHQGDIRSRSL